jgi:hypothetical protein
MGRRSRSEPSDKLEDAFSVLPHLKARNVHDMGRGYPVQEQKAALGKMLEMPVPVLVCPSRREVVVVPLLGQYPLHNAAKPAMAFKSDHAGFSRQLSGVSRGIGGRNLGLFSRAAESGRRKGGGSEVHLHELHGDHALPLPPRGGVASSSAASGRGAGERSGGSRRLTLNAANAARGFPFV